jgi:2-C-methyl-D-erythritol 4-phosphate cytidylyltransferase
MKNELTNYAIILASGSGSRFGSNIPKQFTKIHEKTLLEYCIEPFEHTIEIDKIIIVITPEYKTLAKEIISKNNYKKIVNILSGGEIRKDSSYIGINSIKEKEANVLIHDCARALISPKIIKECIEGLKEYNAVDVAIPVTDTILKTTDEIIESIPDRTNLMASQTPQGFKLSLIKKAHELSKNDTNFTDDCGLIVKYGLAKIKIIKGDKENFKITYPQDFYIAENILNERKNKNLQVDIR